MSRAKKGKNALKSRRNILRAAKGYRFGRSKKERQAREALFHAGTYAFAHRRDKKSDFRRLWQTQIGAAAHTLNLSYSSLMGSLKKKNIRLNRKVLAHIAQDYPEVFTEIVTASEESR